MGTILVGTSSWTDPTLIKGGRFYPPSAKTAKDRLQFYASRFPLVEVDSAYYGIPEEATARLWVERTPPDFTFDIKAFRLFTQHPGSPIVFPSDIKNTLPREIAQKKNLYYRELPREILDELWNRFDRALLPLDSAGKLGFVLFQFPPWFFPGEEQRQYIAQCQQRLPQYRLAVEFRHNSWLNEKNMDRTFAFLREKNLIYVCVDEPQGFQSSLPPVTEATSDISAVRFHGRNKATWEVEGRAASSRFNYLYNLEELREWAPRIKALSEKTNQTHLLFNNCHGDKAVTNARELRDLLES
jgi:uncharacterized protein YecE (DUF72 family)